MQNRLKVFIIIGLNPFYENTASANRWRTLIEGLNDLGVNIELLVSVGYNSWKEIKNTKDNKSIKGIGIRYLNFLYSGNIWFRRLNSYFLIGLTKGLVHFKILRIAKRNRNAIFWTSSDLGSFKLAVYLKSLNPKLTTFIEMSEFLDIHLYNESRGRHLKEGSMRQEYFEKKAILAYEGMALMTNTLMTHYKQFGLKKPRLVHLPMTVDIDRFRGVSKPLDGFLKPYVAFIGVMNNAKDGVDVLIKAFSEISDSNPKYKLYLVGPWHYDTPGHLKLISDLNLGSRIFYKGVFARDLVTSIINNADILALPRPDSKQAQGGFPTKLGEYLASGKPVCATSVGELPNYLKNNESVFFAEPGSVKSFTEAMRRVLLNPIEADQVGLQGREVAVKYFNKKIQSQILFDYLHELKESV
jgi:glycosyltransferase involved in cell wall biosynthesis